MLKPRYVRARLEWAYQNSDQDDFWWANVMFSDEKKWNMDGSDGYKHRIDTRAKQSVLIRRHSGGESVMIWGGFCEDRKTTLDFLDGRVTSVKYIAIL
uniref:AlNc14C164G7857 protein n=1 Tax=Albugo laibachii Nc14 TaxID=890382 RepID=F0WN25_9STRA|nr:AlNc14C164G7857 [Albugo laibachii Nc14]|eukprot:CCA22712.1 AlNc14C164G7857 [Albugo laibachii Nc14]